MDDVTRVLLQQSVAEIRSLRRANEIMGAQLSVVEVFRAALLGPPQPQGMVQDLCHQIQQELDKDAAKRTPPKV